MVHCSNELRTSRFLAKNIISGNLQCNPKQETSVLSVVYCLNKEVLYRKKMNNSLSTSFSNLQVSPHNSISDLAVTPRPVIFASTSSMEKIPFWIPYNRTKAVKNLENFVFSVDKTPK